MSLKNFKFTLYFFRVLCYPKTGLGSIAQLVRVPASHAGSRGFESLYSHQIKKHRLNNRCFFISTEQGGQRTSQIIDSPEEVVTQ